MAKVFLFWDNSNIFISARRVADAREGLIGSAGVRIEFTNMFKLAAAGREIGKAVVVGSIPPEQRQIWDRMRKDTGIEPELYERGSVSSTEQGLDQCLQTHMLRAYADHAEEPQVAVLLTGDGEGYDVGTGFHADLERMHKNGWGVEVIAWNRSCRRALREWASKAGVYIDLETYYDSVTFCQGTRSPGPLNLTHRAKASPRPSRVAAARAEVKLQLQGELETAKKEAREHATRASEAQAEVERLRKQLAKQKYAVRVNNQSRRRR